MFKWFRRKESPPILRIESAAIMYKGIIYSAPKPKRHHHILEIMVEYCKLVPPFVGMTQGFLTSRGDFVNRKEAFKIAKEANQLLREYPGATLFSEEVW